MGGGSTKLNETKPVDTISSQPTATNSPQVAQVQRDRRSSTSKSKTLTQVNIFFGSNSGTAEQFCLSLKSTLNANGFLLSFT